MRLRRDEDEAEDEGPAEGWAVRARRKDEGEMDGVWGGADELRRKPRYSSRMRRRILRTMLPDANSERGRNERARSRSRSFGPQGASDHADSRIKGGEDGPLG